MLIEAIFYPLAGFFMKISDDALDEKKNMGLAVFSGLICVLAIGYLSVNSSDAATIFIGIMVGTFLSGKVDRLAHIITLIIFLSILVIFGIPPLGIIALLICTIAAYLDEMGNDSSWLKSKKKLNIFFKYRLALKLAVLFLAMGGLIQYLHPEYSGIILFQPETFIYFLLFDLAYEVAGLLFNTIYEGLNGKFGIFG
ncbi:MAG: hypothetical protein QM405_07695 [Euryarchaeota archaeon]|nr:hypothetical protein [Euryarchaeota archaeon]HNS25737.1 hypothetical protein [Methanobacteriaceae archaeon]